MCTDVEALVLTGGSSRRMGADKATMVVGEKTLAEAIVCQLNGRTVRTTILGPDPIGSCACIRDSAPYEGPLLALARFSPSAEFCFVGSCDMPGFDGKLVRLLRQRIAQADAAIVTVGGSLQPLCALYRTTAWEVLRQLAASGERRVMAWIDRLSVELVVEADMFATGISSDAAHNVNTRLELDEFLRLRS